MSNVFKNLNGYNGDLLIKAGVEYGPEAIGVGAFTDSIPEWIVCPSGCIIQVLEEYRDGTSTSVLSERGLTAAYTLPDNYILKSSTGAGFSRLKITGADAAGFRAAPEIARNFVDSVNSGINYVG